MFRVVALSLFIVAAAIPPFAGTGCLQVQVLLGAKWIGSLFYGDEGQQP